MHELLTTTEMAEADRRAVAVGVSSLTLMENAGRAVADEAVRMVAAGAAIAVLCGPGNNGGDGFVAARYLKERGFDVHLATVVALDQLQGDAAVMAGKWDGPVRSANELDIDAAALVIDALFGAGLARDISADVGAVIAKLTRAGCPVLAVDVPSGVDGNTGTVRGRAFQANKTVTFFRKKPGHVLMPGRAFCGELIVADIAIPDRVLDGQSVTAFENDPGLWIEKFPWPSLDLHKYQRGHTVVVSGPLSRTGAARLAARGALRVGAGLVTIASPPDALEVHAAHLTAIMLARCADGEALRKMMEDPRIKSIVIGPACGIGEDTCQFVKIALTNGNESVSVLDADALTSFASEPQKLFQLTRGNGRVVMTPHDGEFRRLFPDISDVSKLQRARQAAEKSGSVVVFKGPDTVIASPDGRAAINTNAPQTLATAGSGDVLAGFVAGLLAQGMPAYESACAAVWLHGECANKFGIGLIAEDLPEILPRVLATLLKTVET